MPRGATRKLRSKVKRGVRLRVLLEIMFWPLYVCDWLALQYLTERNWGPASIFPFWSLLKPAQWNQQGHLGFNRLVNHGKHNSWLKELSLFGKPFESLIPGGSWEMCVFLAYCVDLIILVDTQQQLPILRFCLPQELYLDAYLPSHTLCPTVWLVDRMYALLYLDKHFETQKVITLWDAVMCLYVLVCVSDLLFGGKEQRENDVMLLHMDSACMGFSMVCN